MVQFWLNGARARDWLIEARVSYNMLIEITQDYLGVRLKGDQIVSGYVRSVLYFIPLGQLCISFLGSFSWSFDGCFILVYV